MPSIAVIGSQWGDEGKAKIIDVLAEYADVVARFQGGHNAGHTVHFDGQKFVFHLIPSGILRPDITCMLGNGLVIEPEALFKEIDGLVERGLEVEGRIFISGKAHVVTPYHLERERKFEEFLGAKKIGTTLRGIGPCYHSKSQRTGIRIIDLLHKDTLIEKLKLNLSVDGYDPDSEETQRYINDCLEKWLKIGERLKPMVTDVSVLLSQALDEGKRVVFEGAQGTMLDIDHGTYPFVTCSNTVAGGICTGLGIGPHRLGYLIGVSKIYTTRVGQGPFPTEEEGEIGQKLQQIGNEYGSTTGRPRRCGWLDLTVLRYAKLLNGFDTWAITKLDVMDTFEEIKICYGYKYKGELLKHYPLDSRMLLECEPQYKIFRGWRQQTTEIRDFQHLPSQAQTILHYIETETDTPVLLVSTGADREKMTLRKAFSFVKKEENNA